jgi:hypothetical protein
MDCSELNFHMPVLKMLRKILRLPILGGIKNKARKVNILNKEMRGSLVVPATQQAEAAALFPSRSSNPSWATWWALASGLQKKTNLYN